MNRYSYIYKRIPLIILLVPLFSIHNASPFQLRYGSKSAMEENEENINEFKNIKENWSKYLSEFNKEGIRINEINKGVEVDGVIIRDQISLNYPIEYVVVSEGGNTHEAFILIKATPSNLNAALLSLGLRPGKTVTFVEKEKHIEAELIESGVSNSYIIVPPKGQIVYIYIRQDESKRMRHLEDYLVDIRTGRTLERTGWVYIGSRFAEIIQGRQKVLKYMADMERNIIATYLTGFGNAIFDINNINGVNDSIYDINPDLIQPIGTKVTVVFSLDPL